MMKNLFLDLCSGFGGASEAFANNPHWEVIRIENNELLGIIQHTRLLDVLEWKSWIDDIDFSQYDEIIVWASPPCREFSDAYNSPKSRAVRAGELEEYEPDMEIFDACLEIIKHVNPTYWILENVKGASPYFKQELGEHKQKIGPFLLWGKFPFIDVGPYFTHYKSENDVHSSNPLRVNFKAKIPFEVSAALLVSLSTLVRLDKF